MTGSLSIGERLRRNRHFPRVCTSCRAPMACQEEECWRCGEAWAQEPQAPQATRAALRLIAASPTPPPQPQSTAERLARLRTEAHA